MSEQEKDIKTAPQDKGIYSASSIRVLEGLEAVRKCPAMYIGDISEKRLHHLVYEVADNSIDEVLAGYCTEVLVEILPNNSIQVTDNGRGVLTDMCAKEGKSTLEVVMTVLYTGGKFDKGSYKVLGGLHGVSVSCINALSESLIAEVHRDGKIYRQKCSRGKPLTGVEVVDEASDTGTRITFKPNDTIFRETIYSSDTLSHRLHELSYLNAGLHLKLVDHRAHDEEGQPKPWTFYSEDGLSEFVRYVDGAKESLIHDVIHHTTEKQGAPVEMALTYNTSYQGDVYIYVNDIHAIEGGTHLTGSRRGLTCTLKRYATDSHLLDKIKEEISGDDFHEGLATIVSVKVAEPQFEGQTKTKLGNNEIVSVVDAVVSEALEIYLEEHPLEAKLIVDKVILAAQARHATRRARELVQHKPPLTGGGPPGKLADCPSRDLSECELFIVEGDSAGGTAKQGRDSKYQAVLPLCGKILNVEKATQHRILDNAEIENIYTALGVTVGTEEDSETLNLSKLRYHKIIIMTGADVDGAHIATLILTFFFRNMHPLIENGYVYIANPPLYLCRKDRIKEYCWIDDEKVNFVAKYGNEQENHIKMQRYKDLGEMNDIQLWDTMMNPQTHTLCKVTIDNLASADSVFSMLMSEDVKSRHEFIEGNATYANIDVQRLTMETKHVAALAMVCNDDSYLRRWTAYYGRELGEEHLYIYLDGKDQPLLDWCPQAAVVAVDKVQGQIVSAEKERLAFLSERAKELFTTGGYDLVIGVNADETLVVGPLVGMGLKEYLSQIQVGVSALGLGIDVGQHLEKEDDIREDSPFPQQRHYARLSTCYTKPRVIAQPVVQGSGFHHIKGYNFTTDPQLYLFHFGYFDMKRVEARFADPDRREAGWTKHITKRLKTIQQVTNHKVRPWDNTIRLAHKLQIYTRPPYAWNKPAMLGPCLIVEIPERSHDTV